MVGRLVTVHWVCERLDYKPKTVYRMAREDRIPGAKRLPNGRTIQITLPFNQLTNMDTDTPPPQIEANLAVATRALASQSRGYMIERWGRVQNTYFNIQTRPINQNLYDTVQGVTFPQNVPGGLDQANLNLVSITYRVVAEGAQ